ncbi:MAG: hypothetical protein U9N56_06870 [Actinomycetota bacterium]|nr:hypothetical protein [Actinomycetota bacterium]
MSVLDWTEQPDGWSAGSFRIELVGPRLWVMTNLRQRSDLVSSRPSEKIVATSGSLSVLKYQADEFVKARARNTQLIRRSMILILSMLALGVATASNHSWSALVTVVGSSAMLMSALAIVNVVAGRAADDLSGHFQ